MFVQAAAFLRSNLTPCYLLSLVLSDVGFLTFTLWLCKSVLWSVTAIITSIYISVCLCVFWWDNDVSVPLVSLAWWWLWQPWHSAPIPLPLQIALQNTTSLCNPPNPPQHTHIFSHTYSQKLVSHPPPPRPPAPARKNHCMGPKKNELLKQSFWLLSPLCMVTCAKSNIITAVVRWALVLFHVVGRASPSLAS